MFSYSMSSPAPRAVARWQVCRLAPLVAIAGLLSDVIGQCTPAWQGPPVGGVLGEVKQILEWDPDGAGPATPVVVVAGRFSVAAGLPAANLAFYDAATNSWSVPPGTNGEIRALAVDASGSLWIGGDFDTVAGIAISGVARWDGTSWAPAGFGVDTSASGVYALEVLPGGELLVGGDFQQAGGIAAANVAQWDGAAWTSVGAGLTQSSGPVGARVHDFVLAGSQVYAVGTFIRSGPTVLSGVAQLVSGSWLPVGSFPQPPLGIELRAAAATANGDLYVVDVSPLAEAVRRWDGVQWTALPSTPWPYSIHVTPTGRVLVGTERHFGLGTIQEWDGVAWQLVTPLHVLAGVEVIASLPSQQNRLACGGSFNSIAGVSALGFSIELPSGGWLASASGAFSPAPALYAGPDGEILAAGDATLALDGVPIGPLARWNGSTWISVPGSPARIRDLEFDGRGGFVTTVLSAVSPPVPPSIDRWRNGSWSNIGFPAGVTGFWSVTVTPNGDIFAGGIAGCWRWDGASWQQLSTRAALVEARSDGSVVASVLSGQFGAPRRMMAWDGAGWTDLDPNQQITSTVQAIAILPDGRVAAVATFAGSSEYVAILNGAVWQPLGSGPNGAIDRLVATPDGRLIATGSFTACGGVPCPGGRAIWDGSQWSPLTLGYPIGSVASLPNGDVWTTRLGVPAVLATPCPASANRVYTSCMQNGGGRLTATRWPLLGATARTLATGLPTQSIVVGVVGMSTIAVPLSSLFSFATSGCDLVVAPDHLQLGITTGDYAELAIVVPTSSSLVGAAFHEQFGVFDLDPAGALVGVETTDALSLVVGRVQ